jgi:hypothetical protein
MLAKEIPPETATGELALRTVLAIPSPIFPPKLVPQQYVAPEVVRPQVWEFAGAIIVNEMPPAT